MKCSSCIGGGRRSLSSSDHESTTAPPVTADREYREDGKSATPDPPTGAGQGVQLRGMDSPTAEDPSGHSDTEDYRPPSITIEELEDEVFEDYIDGRLLRSSEEDAQQDEYREGANCYAHLLLGPPRAPLEVIREEELSDCSEGEFSHRFTPQADPAPGARETGTRECTIESSSPATAANGNGGTVPVRGEPAVAHGLAKFSPAKVLREILRYRKRRHHRKQPPTTPTPSAHQFLHQAPQEATTCLLVGAKEADLVPQEYRSVCTTETVSCEMQEVEVLFIGSNSSSMDDLSDIDTEEGQLRQEEALELDVDPSATTVQADVLGKQQQRVINDHDGELVTGGVLCPLDDRPLSRQLAQESITETVQADLDNRVPEIDTASPGERDDGDCSDHDLHQTPERSVQTSAPLGAERAASDDPFKSAESAAAPAHEASSHSASNVADDGGGDDDADDHRERCDWDGRNGDIREHLLPRTSSPESGRSPVATPAADAGEEPLGVSSSGVAPVDRDRVRASEVGCIRRVVDDGSVFPKVSLSPHSSLTALAPALNRVDESGVNHCIRHGEGAPPSPPPRAINASPTMSIEDAAGSATVAVVKKGNRPVPPPPLPPVPAPRVAAIPLPPPPPPPPAPTATSSADESAAVTNSGRYPVRPKDEQPPEEEQVQEFSDSDTPTAPPATAAAAPLVPLTVEALSTSSASTLPHDGDDQIHSGGHTSQTVHADAHPNSAQDSVDAVAAAAAAAAAAAPEAGDRSVLLKYMREGAAAGDTLPEQQEESNSKQPVARDQVIESVGRQAERPTAGSYSDPGERRAEGHAPKIEPSGGGSRRRGGQYLCDGFEPTDRSHTAREDPTHRPGAGMTVRAEPTEAVPSERLSNGGQSVNKLEPSPRHARPAQDPALVADLRTEISRLKDAELQEEFHKLELETARYERELQQITVPSRRATPQPLQVTNGNDTYFVSKQQDFVLHRSSQSSTASQMAATAVNVHHARGQQPGTERQLYGEWQQKMEQREERRQQRTGATVEQGPPEVPPKPVVAPAPPSSSTTDAADEEIFTKKVKDRVRDLMAAQAAAAAEQTRVAEKQRGRLASSAPSTPTAERRHIEAELREFREIRQRESQKMSLFETSGQGKDNRLQQRQQQQQQQQNYPPPPVQPASNSAPSRIPLATSREPVSAPPKKRTPQPFAGGNGEQTSGTDQRAAETAEEVKVNVAALIAAHQEKQQLQTISPAVKPTGRDPEEEVPAQDASEPVSVSDKCLQFEQRIHRSVIGKTDHPPGVGSRKQQSNARAGTTTSGSCYGEECCATSADKSAFCSEADLLHEIDHALVLAKDFLFSRDTATTLKLGPKYKAKTTRPGVWSPFNRSTEILTKEELAERSASSAKGKPSEPQQPIWTPRSAPPSPGSERREFRPIGFESPTPTRRVLTPSPATPSASVAAPWTQPGYNPPLTPASQPTKPSPLQTSASNPTIGGTAASPRTTTTAATPPPAGQQYQVRFAPQQRSPALQEPTINSLLKSKDGKTASVVGSTDSSERIQRASGNRTVSSSTTTTTSTSTSYQQQSEGRNVPRIVSPGPRNEPLPAAQQTDTLNRKMQTQTQQPHKVDGIGPTTREGMPLTLRSEIDEGNRDKWYKQMYHTLHKAHDDDDYVTVRYKTRRGYPYKSSGYQSEPEPNYDSDYTIKYSTLDRRRTPLDLSPSSYSKFNTLQSNPSPQPTHHFHQASVKSGQPSYKNQPGRIENYTPGRSSISERESKEWWDEVMDIFNGQLEHQKLTTSKTYTEGNLSRALKEQGYESDSTLVFRKREPPTSSALSPVEQKQYYKTMQAGGEIPLQGFRKPAPEKPKDQARGDETDVKVEISEEGHSGHTNPFLSQQPGELACYPITSISRPLDMFGSFPRETRTFVPPVPPSRKSSRSNSTLKIMSQVKTTTGYDRRTILERSTKFRSKSAGPPFYAGTMPAGSTSIMTSSSASMVKEEKNHENSTRVASKRYASASYRVSSGSPTAGGPSAPTAGAGGHQRKASPSPVAFGRGISKERTFAEEKKRIEEKLPKVVSVSTSILRNPELKSPNEVKKALRSSYLLPGSERPERSSLKRFSSNATFRSASSVYSSNKSLNGRVMSPAATMGHKREEKSYKVTVALPSTSKTPKELVVKKAQLRKTTAGRTSAPSVTIKTSFQKASKAFGLKAKTPSTQSLARTSSTYSIDSTNSKRRSRLCYIPVQSTPSARSSPRGRPKVFPGSLDRGLRPKSPAVQERYSERNIVQQTGQVRTDSFFQNLFLKGAVAATDSTAGASSASVLEKARQWNSLSSRSEPTLKQPNYYLSQAKPVSSSKFKSLDRRDDQPRRTMSVQSSSFEYRPAGEVIEQVNRFESLLNDDDEDEQHQFGYVRGRRMKIDYSFHERSRSEPPTATAAATTTTTTTLTKSTVIQEELISAGSPRTIVGRRCQVAQRTSRSPSCRRIQYLKGKEGQVKRIVRARSLSSHGEQERQRLRQGQPKDALVRSHSLNLNQDGQSRLGVSRSRFRDLNTFYSSLERLGQLERVTTSSSSSDLRPARRSREEEIIDFDLWKRVRDHEKAERELHQLKSKLKLDQREKDLFFLPRDPEEVRWRSDLDTGLRNREKSVDDLKCLLSQQTLYFEDAKLRELEVRKDHYKPLWRGSSVVDVATQLEEKYSSSGEKRDEGTQSLDVISSNLLSTLSSEQMRKLKSQLSEIYCSGSPGSGQTRKQTTPPKQQQQLTDELHQETYVINVPERASRLESLLKVRSNSVLTPDQVNPSQLRCHQQLKPDPGRTEGTTPGKALVVATLQKTFEAKAGSTGGSMDRATLSRTLCQELKDKILEKHHTLPSVGRKKKNDARPTILPAHEGDKRFLSLDESGLKSAQERKPAKELRSASASERRKDGTARKERPHSYCDTESISSETSNRTVIFRSNQQLQPDNAVPTDEVPTEDIRSKIKYFEERHTTDETPTVTIYHAREDSSPSEDEMSAQQQQHQQLQQQQQQQQQQPQVRETQPPEGCPRGSTLTLSQSFTDLKDLFGERRSASGSMYASCPSSASAKEVVVLRGQQRSLSPKHFTFRSRSSTPDYATCIQTGEVKKIKDRFESLDGSGLPRQPEDDAAAASNDRQYQSDSELSRQPFGEKEHPVQRRERKPGSTTIVRHHEAGDVTRMTHRYELQAAGRARGRKSRKERVISPIPRNPFRKDDRFMPHINVISKTASLKREIKPTSTRTSVLLQSSQLPDAHQQRRSASSGSEREFERRKSKFELGASSDDSTGGLSLLGKMYTSVPDVRELQGIPGYLSGAWIAHQFPKPTDNARSLTAPEQSPPGRECVRRGSAASPDRPAGQHHSPHHHRHIQQQPQPHHPQSLRSHSSSPPRQKEPPLLRSSDATASCFLQQFYMPAGSVDDGDPRKGGFEGRPKGSERFVSSQQLEAEALWRKIQLAIGGQGASKEPAAGKTPTVTFEEPHIQFPSPPMKGAPQQQQQLQPPPPPPPPLTSSSIAISSNGAESPRRYIESDVNIHYKTPIRFEYKEPIPDEELAYRQAEHMRRVYQEERRRKYMHELEDMNARRHTDNILPSQKSPIPLNRYDDFAADLSPKPQPLKQPKTIARALYNFQGQSIRELSFRKGDIIHLRRQIDKNWYEGEHNANVGLLPANYIEILNRDNANAKPLPKKPIREGKARAKFNFTAQTAVELSLLKGELVTLTRRVDDNWFEGKIGSKKGIFPVSYVEILTDINGEESYDIEPIVNRSQPAHGVSSQPPQSQALTTHYSTSHTNGRISPAIMRETKTVQKTEVLHVDTSNEPISYRALYNYKPQNSDELELVEGDVVYVLEKCDDGWYVGTSARTGCFGTFPGNYVSKM